jgi:hypothetical protein
LRLAKLQGQLLDRDEVAREFGAMLSAIKSVIQNSRLSKAEKQDVFGQLLSIAEFGDHVAQSTQESSAEDQSPALYSGIDRE